MRGVAVFDLDGTLADTSRDLIAAANAALAGAGHGAPLDGRADALIAFHGGQAMLRAGLERAGGDPAGAPALQRALLDAYERDIAAETALYPGALDALDALAADGWTLAICTNKPHALAERLLDALGIAARFATVLGGDSLPVRKPDPRHLRETIAQAGGMPGCRAFLVGDTINDREAARAARVPCILVGFGPEGAGVARMAPEAVIEDYAALPALIARWGQGAAFGP